ncbi:ankyrin repeat domain-containing protein 18B-like isoform X5 [Camelus ferus]|uniref:Ankyrin repeat domain-containing protein 18B-like isoform X5 n=1 Tax=Camelus ferus TaxID=419612 RepID=A0A8B8RTU6_CAMFR|nr:ankyrin repeat domain-containing protein 18B-like isoform X5 [Camelus ferus]
MSKCTIHQTAGTLAGPRPWPVQQRRVCALPWLARGPRNLTALHLACSSGKSSVVTLLIEWKCDLNARDEEGKTALMKAVECQEEVCVTIMLKRGADPNLKDNCQNTALHYAVLAENTSIATKLLRYNADIEAINKYNFTPFLLAIRENKEMVRFLIENGANIHAVDKAERSALMLAVFHDSPDIVKLLLQKRVNADSRDLHGMSAERYACRNGFKHLYQLIVDYRDGKIPTTPPQNSDLGQSSAKESLPSSHAGAENVQEKLQLSSKDNEEETVVKLGTRNGSYMDSLKNVEQKTDLVVEVSPRFEDISVTSISPKHDVDDSRPPSDGNLDLAPKKVRHPRFAKPIQAWGEPMINTEAKDGVLKPGTSTFFEDNNSNNENEDAVRTFSQPSTEVSGFSHPAFPAPEPLTSSAVLGVTEEEARKPKTGGKENGTRTINSVLKEQADHSKLISVDGAHKSDRDLDLQRASEEEQERLDGSENSHSQACTVKEKKSEDQIKQINLSLVHLQKMPREPEMNKEHDRKDVPVSSKHSCVEKHEDMWVKQGKLDWKNTSEFITKKANQKISKILEKCKIIFHRKGGSLRDNSELHGDLKELPSNVTDNIFDSEEKDAPGASVSVGSQASLNTKSPVLKKFFHLIPSLSQQSMVASHLQNFI